MMGGTAHIVVIASMLPTGSGNRETLLLGTDSCVCGNAVTAPVSSQYSPHVTQAFRHRDNGQMSRLRFGKHETPRSFS
jgi:hypothetical protein